MNEHDEKCESGNRKKGDGSGNKRSTRGIEKFRAAARHSKGNIESALASENVRRGAEAEGT